MPQKFIQRALSHGLFKISLQIIYNLARVETNHDLMASPYFICRQILVRLLYNLS